MNIFKVNIYPGETVVDLCDAILVDCDCLEIDGAFNTDHLCYITHIFDDTSDSRLHNWVIRNYKEVA